jgi:four helix bundle protein
MIKEKREKVKEESIGGQFEDLLIWQKARVLTKEIYLITKQQDFSRDFGLTSQMQRATVSIMSNIAEGFERQGRREFHQFLTISKASCGELRSQLYTAFDLGYITQAQFNILQKQALELSRMLQKFKAALKNQQKRAKP